MPLSHDRAIREAGRSALTHRGTSLVLAAVVLAMTITTFITAGRAAAAEADILASVEAAGPRLIGVTVVDPNPGLGSDAIERLQSISNVEWVLGLGAARDVSSAATAMRANVAARTLLTDLPPVADITQGRSPQPGEAIVSPHVADQLQLEFPVGSLRDGAAVRPIVGTFEAQGVIVDLERLVLVAPERGVAERATQLYVLAEDAQQIAEVVAAIAALSGVPSDQLTFHTSDSLVELGNAASGTIGALGRQLSVGAIVVGALLCALTMTLSMLTRRRDIGRRRALGASRSAIVALALAEAALPTSAGILVGASGGLVAVVAVTGTAPPSTFVIAACSLIAVASIGSVVPPAIHAARQDPLRILRVP